MGRFVLNNSDQREIERESEGEGVRGGGRSVEMWRWAEEEGER